ncbi:MAG: hypothetical protein JO354_01065 [Verrucomicrobia bacterium]|nr:hypothetical protein [Verrucomicrobiota bacterium]
MLKELRRQTNLFANRSGRIAVHLDIEPFSLFNGTCRCLALIRSAAFAWHAVLAFALAAAFAYVALVIFLEFYESERPHSEIEDRTEIRRVINRCALGGSFVAGVISLGLFLSR